jgi:alkanesulfonate monooxygenase SsuD/methylene tetrahydromethanopterin reductase-like flavin-dependent oxidoreductase (luciferase family)
VRVGIAPPALIPDADPEAVFEWAEAAEAGPFSHLAAIDRIKFGNQEPLVLLAALAGATRTIRLATTILIAPLRNTSLLAKELATLDRLSRGRLVVGVGLGAREDDYEVAEVPIRGRGERLASQLDALRAFWEGDDVGPSPVRSGGPPILVGGNSGEALARMARFADGYIHGGGPPRAFARAAELARAAWIDAGRPGKPELWGQGYFALGDAAERGADYLRTYYAFTGPFAERIAEAQLTRPQAVMEFVRGYEEAGCDELSLLPSVPDREQLDRLTEIVDRLGLETKRIEAAA